MNLLIVLLLTITSSSSMTINFDNDITPNILHCHDGTKTYHNVSATAYYPMYDDDNDRKDFTDNNGKKLRTLQAYLDDQVSYVTVSMDKYLKIPYGTNVCIPELNDHYKRHINFQIRDSGDNVNGFGYDRIDICVRTEVDSYDRSVNINNVTLVF